MCITIPIIQADEFDAYWRAQSQAVEDDSVTDAVRNIIDEVRREGDAALWRFSQRFEKALPAAFELPQGCVEEAYRQIKDENPGLVQALEYAAANIKTFAEKQREQFRDFEIETAPGLYTGQKVIPVERAAVYAPGGAYPLKSSVLMGLIPGLVSGVSNLSLFSPPGLDGLPDSRILAAAHIAWQSAAKHSVARHSVKPLASLRVFALGGAQAIAAAAFGSESVPRCDVIVGPGNKYVAAAKRLIYGQTGIDFVAGPTDVLIITGPIDNEADAALVAADLLAQAEHDKDARARCLTPDAGSARLIQAAVAAQMETLPTKQIAEASLNAGGLIVVYQSVEEALHIANTIAPEHLELHFDEAEQWLPRLHDCLHNYGSLFIGSAAAEVLGDYSAGINHTLPTSASARFTGGLSVRHFLKTVTTLRVKPGPGSKEADAAVAAYTAAKTIAKAEGLEAHAAAAQRRILGY